MRCVAALVSLTTLSHTASKSTSISIFIQVGFSFSQSVRGWPLSHVNVWARGTTRVLHIHNGESSAGTLRQSSIQGEQFAFREVLMVGPTPAGLSNDAWRTTRAQHLSDAYDIDVGQCERDLLHQEEVLASFQDHDEVVLLVEHDLVC